MDILNFISWIRGGRKVTTVDPNSTLIPVGLKDPRRDDGYLPGAITVADLQFNASYDAYTVSLGQIEDNAPFPLIEFENTLEVIPSFYREDVGVYIIEFDKDIFNSPMDYCVIQNPTTVFPGDPYTVFTVQTKPIFDSALVITTFANGELSDNVMGVFGSDYFPNVILDIRVYPNAINLD